MDEAAEIFPAETPQKTDENPQEVQEKLRAAEQRMREAVKEAEQLKAAMEKLKLDTALMENLREAGAEDAEYLIYQLKKGSLPCPALTSDGSLTGWEEALGQLKSRFPGQFRSAERKFTPKKLEKGNDPGGLTRAELLRRSYTDRAKLYNDTPDIYAAALENTGMF